MPTFTFLCVILAATFLAVNGEERIYNGKQARPGQFQYFASIKRSGTHFCGGSLISENLVITAAHCVSGKSLKGTLVEYSTKDFSIRIGCHRQDEPLSDSCVERRVHKAIIHPMWDGDISSFGADLALLELNDVVDSITPIQMASKARVGDKASIPGFGETEKNGMDGDSPNILRYVNQTIDYIEDSLLTTLGDVRGPCNGDSGGPLITTPPCDNTASCERIAAIVVFGTDACDSFNDLDGFVYLPKFAPWIDAHVKGEVDLAPLPIPDTALPLIDNGIYRLKAVSQPCKYMFLASSSQNDCADTSVKLYYRSQVALSEISHWKIVAKSDDTVYLQSVAKMTCVNSYLEQRGSGDTILGPINESWMLQKSGKPSGFSLRSLKTGQYVSSDETCRPSNVQSKDRLVFQLEKVIMV